jgi:hypothetical protein
MIMHEKGFIIVDQLQFEEGVKWANAFSRKSLLENAYGKYQNGEISQDFLNGFCQGLEDEENCIKMDLKR